MDESANLVEFLVFRIDVEFLLFAFADGLTVLVEDNRAFLISMQLTLE